MTDPQTHTKSTQEYYDGHASQVYQRIWQDNIHMGTWDRDGMTVQDAMDRTNQIVGERAQIKKGDRVLDAGCGHGTFARHLARTYGCHVTGISIGEKELALAAERAEKAGVGDLCDFRYGDYHDLAFEDGAFDVVVSQDAFTHGADKAQIIREVTRVLKPGGLLVFSDLALRKGIPEDAREHIFQRISAPSIWDIPDYEAALKSQNMEIVAAEDWTVNVEKTYAALAEEVRKNRDALAEATDAAFAEKTLAGYEFSTKAAKDKHLGQCFFVARKPA